MVLEPRLSVHLQMPSRSRRAVLRHRYPMSARERKIEEKRRSKMYWEYRQLLTAKKLPRGLIFQIIGDSPSSPIFEKIYAELRDSQSARYRALIQKR